LVRRRLAPTKERITDTLRIKSPYGDERKTDIPA
jgi:hypothetical protein